MIQKTLFDVPTTAGESALPPPSAPYIPGCETSQQAAEEIAPQTGMLRAMVYQFLLERGDRVGFLWRTHMNKRLYRTIERRCCQLLEDCTAVIEAREKHNRTRDVQRQGPISTDKYEERAAGIRSLLVSLWLGENGVEEKAIKVLFTEDLVAEVPPHRL